MYHMLEKLDKLIHVRVSSSTYNKLKMASEKRRIKVAQVLRELIEAIK